MIINSIWWHVSPEIMKLGPISLRWYGLLFALAFVFGYMILTKVYKREKKTAWRYWTTFHLCYSRNCNWCTIRSLSFLWSFILSDKSDWDTQSLAGWISFTRCGNRNSDCIVSFLTEEKRSEYDLDIRQTCNCSSSRRCTNKTW